ncbi:MAG: membrane protein insertase YidC [Desulfobacterales bacterium]|nr:membrane protein insertase YidC [Desulfobacterales bacterium]
MDNGRMIIAIALSFLVFLVWQFVFAPQETQRAEKKQPEQVAAPEKTRQEPSEVKETVVVEKSFPARGGDTLPAGKARIITVDTPLYRVKISEDRAVFTSYVLKGYRERVENDSPYKELIPEVVRDGILQTDLINNSVSGLNKAIYRAARPSRPADQVPGSISVQYENEAISFFWKSPAGVVVEKKFSFSPDSYMIKMAVTINNGSDRPIQDQLAISLKNTLPDGKETYGFSGPSALINGKLEQIKISKIKDKNVYTGNLKWIAVQDRYFLAGIIPEKAVDASMRLFVQDEKVLENQIVLSLGEIAQGSGQTRDFQVFLGPKSVKILNRLGYELDKVLYFGWFDFIAKPCLWLMNFLYGFIPNYGIAIIILTIIVKALLWPLGQKSYKSMNEMKRLQPLMAEIREKYKNDKKRMNQEIMGLYKVYKINPMGGCLPMIVQLPFFFALYRMLYEAIELRHAPFLWWINDLSAPDRLFQFGFSIPFMQAPYGIPVLTIVMGGTMFLQQKMSPPPGDPSQAKMMMFMPIIFTFIFINFSSGLVLYWLVNNILSISQQYYISRRSA